MKCQFCQKQLQDTSGGSIYEGSDKNYKELSCIPCSVEYHIAYPLHNQEVIGKKFWIDYNKKVYLMRVDLIKNRLKVKVNFPEEYLLELDYPTDVITPKNALDKLKTYLLFS
jgi:hypothetical protein